jgi:hypothetical protein
MLPFVQTIADHQPDQKRCDRDRRRKMRLHRTTWMRSCHNSPLFTKSPNLNAAPSCLSQPNSPSPSCSRCIPAGPVQKKTPMPLNHDQPSMQERLIQAMRLSVRKLFSTESELVDKQTVRSSAKKTPTPTVGSKLQESSSRTGYSGLRCQFSELMNSFRDQRDSKPYVIDNGLTRTCISTCDFSGAQCQSSIRIQLPLALYLQHKWVSAVSAEPAHIVIVGLGGGSLTRVRHWQLRRARITTIEID